MPQRESILSAVFWLLLYAAATTGLLLIFWEPISTDAIFGEQGIVSSLAALIAAVGAVGAARLALKSYGISQEALRQSKISSRSEKFRAASTMIGQDSGSQRLTGIQVLKDVVDEDPDRYREVVVNLLVDYCAARSTSLRQADGDEFGAHPEVDSAISSTPSDLVAAVRLIGETERLYGNSGRRSDQVFATVRTVRDLALSEVRLEHVSFPRFVFSNFLAAGLAVVDGEFSLSALSLDVRTVRAQIVVSFIDCDFRNAQIEVRGSARVQFSQCDMSGATLQSVGPPIDLIECNVTQMMCNGGPIFPTNCWHRGIGILRLPSHGGAIPVLDASDRQPINFSEWRRMPIYDEAGDS